MAKATVGYKSMYKDPFDMSKPPEYVQITLTIYTDTIEEQTVALALAEEMHHHAEDLAELVELKVSETAEAREDGV
jgi:hypothetical protein